ncbi:ribonuclease H-like domain-containing protein, partial [Salmonella enterica]|uniref:ribonuclease H-like domain-containing protein n=1 Tax=Salmonella enterica TaxID=28901 RepID=UPI003CF8A53D
MDEPIQRSRQFDGFFGDLRVGVLDIETTGLDRWTNEFILGGLLDMREGQLHQVFAEHSSEEGEALEAFAELL